MQLTLEDISDLMDAVENWETKGATGEILGDLMDGILLKELTLEAQEEQKRRRDRQKEERNIETKIRKERSVLLRAKLIGLRQEILSNLSERKEVKIA